MLAARPTGLLLAAMGGRADGRTGGRAGGRAGGQVFRYEDEAGDGDADADADLDAEADAGGSGGGGGGGGSGLAGGLESIGAGAVAVGAALTRAAKLPASFLQAVISTEYVLVAHRQALPGWRSGG